MTPEGRVKYKLRKYLDELGCYQYWPVPMGRGATTIDVLLCHRGLFYGIETKRPDVKKPTKAQECVMAAIAHAGGGVWLENSEGLETTREKLK